MKNNEIKVALIGNPNTGKTSLLNALTGMSQHVGNWPGKTVEKIEGNVDFQGWKFRIVDLPGSYSIAPYSEEEKVTHEFLMTGGAAEIVVQTIDLNALERNLLMTMELLALGKKVVLAFNFNREAARRGIEADMAGIGRILQLPVVQIEANRGENVHNLLKEIIKVFRSGYPEPDYLRELVKENGEIHHDDTIRLLQQKLAPYYRTAKMTKRTERIDSFLLNKYTAFPVFLALIYLIFTTTFTLSTPLVDGMDNIFVRIGNALSSLQLPSFIQSFLVEGVVGGVGSVVSFAPLIFILFVFIALLEDSGYLGRTVVLVDWFFAKFGISGRSFIPMILGFGCNVPAIMATRTIKDRRERMIAIFTNSFMSCGARLPVYLLFAGVFFPKKVNQVVILLYGFGVLVAFTASWILARFVKNTEQQALIIELPPYRMPTVRNVLKHAWYHTKEFIKKAGTIIFGAVLVIWILASLPAGVNYGSEASLLGQIGKFIAPVFEPLGFGDWTFSVALIFGVVAKEIIIGTLGTLYGVGDETLTAAIADHLTPAAGLAFLFFVLLYVPCMATIAVIRKESGQWKYVLLHPFLTFIVAWLIAFVVYRIALLF